MIDITWNCNGLGHNNTNISFNIIKVPKIEEIDTKLFDGKSQKFQFTDNFGDRWICKFDKSQGKNKTYDCLSEHISCTILRLIDINTQITAYGVINSENCVFCKVEKDIKQLKNIESYLENNTLSYDLDEILMYCEERKLNINLFKEHIIKRLSFDYSICNLDLHPGNVGFIKEYINEAEYIYIPSYIYDLGSSFFSKYYPNYKLIEKNLKRNDETIIFNNKKVNIYNIVEEYNLRSYLRNLHKNFKTREDDIKSYLYLTLDDKYKTYIDLCLYYFEIRLERLI